MITHELTMRSPEMIRSHLRLPLTILFAAVLSSCSGLSCDKGLRDSPLLSIVYESGDAVGITQELHYYSGGRLRLLGADWKTYCGRLPPEMEETLHTILVSPGFASELQRFGEVEGLENYFIPETLEITHGIISRRAPIDSLSGSLLQLVEVLEAGAAAEFGKHYQISVVERLNELKSHAGLSTTLDEVERGAPRVNLPR